MKRMRKFKKGVTLVELVVVLGLISILALGIFEIYDVIKKQNNKIESKSKLQFEAQIVNEELFKKIAEAKQITKISNDNSGDIVSFELSTLDGKGQNFVPCIFNIKDKNLNMIYEGKEKNISAKINDFRIKNINKGDNLKECTSVDLEIVLKYHNESYKIIEKIKLRNINT